MEDISSILHAQLPELDEDIVSYLQGILEDLSISDRKSTQTLFDAIGPFLLEGASLSEDEAMQKCREMAVSFGGSGFSSSVIGSNAKSNEIDDLPALLAAPLKMKNQADLLHPQHTSIDMMPSDGSYYDPVHNPFQNTEITSKKAHHHTVTEFMDIKTVPTTQKEMRKHRKANEALQRILRMEAMARAKQEAELSAARMAAIRASRGLANSSNKTGRGGGGGGGGKAANQSISSSINLEKFSLPHPTGSGDLLGEVSLTLVAGHRYGLIGKNGAGKSTLLKYFAYYKLAPLLPYRILLVDQHVEGDDETALSWVLRADVERTALLEEEKKLLHYLGRDTDQGTVADTTADMVAGQQPAQPLVTKGVLPAEYKGVNLELALAEVYERMDVIGTSTAEQRARRILTGLGFTEEMMTGLTTNGLSGGWAMRAALASALYISPDLLLLDEPTNHLDLHALVWLETWLQEAYSLNNSHSNPGMVVVVSHDIMFLQAITTDIIELTSLLGMNTSNTSSTGAAAAGKAGGAAGGNGGALVTYSGDYFSYETNKAEQALHRERLYISYEREREKLVEFISRDGKKYDNMTHQSQRKMKMKQLEKLLGEMKEQGMVPGQLGSLSVGSIGSSIEGSEFTLKFPKPYANFDEGTRMISLTNVSFAWPVISTPLPDTAITTSTTTSQLYQPALFKNIDFTIRAGARIVIVGKNGSGKTCLLNLFLGDLDATSGEIYRHSGCRIRVLQQHHYKGEQLDPSLSALEHMRRLPQNESSALGHVYDLGTRQEETAQRSYLANFGIYGARATIPVRYLSGGQRMRVAMAVAFYARPDILILDEPTNHLDNDTVAALCEALSTYEGTIITVSHDEDYVNKVLHPPLAKRKGKHSQNGEDGKDVSTVFPLAASLQETEQANKAALLGELWILSKQTLTRYEGSFKDYRKQVMKKMKEIVF